MINFLFTLQNLGEVPIAKDIMKLSICESFIPTGKVS